MKWLKRLTMVLGGVSFGFVLLLIYVIAPIGLLFLILREPVSRFASATPETKTFIFTGVFSATVISLAVVTAYRFLRR